MQGKRRRWWSVVKALVGLAIVFFIGRGFARDLSRPELWEQPLHLGWLVPAALLYVVGLSICALYWRRLLVHLGQRPPITATLGAYFIGQLGKYVPGKALALLLRAVLLRRAGVSAGLAGMTAFYEVLVTMTAGAIVAAVLFLMLAGFAPDLPDGAAWRQLWEALRAKDVPAVRPHTGTIVLIAVFLSVLILAPIVPRIFNRLAHRLSLPFRHPSSALPPMRLSYLVEGLVLTALTWPLLGLALAMALQAVPGARLPWDVATLAYLTAAMALSYVAGFAVLIAPGGPGSTRGLPDAVTDTRVARPQRHHTGGCSRQGSPGRAPPSPGLDGRRGGGVGNSFVVASGNPPRRTHNNNGRNRARCCTQIRKR